MLTGQIVAARDLQRRGKVRLHKAKRLLVLGDVICNRLGESVLQHALIKDQLFAAIRLHISRVEIHRYDADQHQHAEDHVQNGNARRQKF